VYAQLVAAHVGDRGAAAASIESQDAALVARIEVAAGKVADLDRRLGQIDQAVEEAAKRGRTNAALSAIEGQHRARGSLVDERNREAGAALKAERAQVAARGRQIDAEAAPIRYVAELVGANTDSERHPVADPAYGHVLRSARHRTDGRGFGTAVDRGLKPALVRSAFDTCRTGLIEGSQRLRAMGLNRSRGRVLRRCLERGS
jgi:hypothetical protein